MNLILTIIIGGVIGWIASLFMKTEQDMGWIANIIAGIVGAMLVGWLNLGDPLSNGFDVVSFVLSIIGAMAAIGLWKVLTDRRPL